MDGSRGESGVPKNYKNIGFLCKTGMDPLQNHKATQAAFDVWPSSARQRNAIYMAFHWRADDGLFIAVFGSYSPSSTKKKTHKKQNKKNVIKFGPPVTKLSGSAHAVIHIFKTLLYIYSIYFLHVSFS